MLTKILKGLGILVGLLLLLLVMAAAGVYFISESMLNKSYSANVEAVAIPAGAASIERGRHLATAVSDCVGCHGGNLAGGVVFDDPAIGHLEAPNLTKGRNGFGGSLSDADFVRVIRHGILPNGKSVRIMPADNFTYLNDADLGALIAYVKSVPPVDSDPLQSNVGPVGRVLMATGQLPIMVAEHLEFSATPAAVVAPAPSAAYGAYLSKVAGCVGCHGPGFSGGEIPGSPPGFPKSANLTPAGALAGWSETDFIQTIRTGKDPSGRQLVEQMPWVTYRNMSDDELKALWAFLKTLPAKAYGGR